MKDLTNDESFEWEKRFKADKVKEMFAKALSKLTKQIPSMEDDLLLENAAKKLAYYAQAYRKKGLPAFLDAKREWLNTNFVGNFAINMGSETETSSVIKKDSVELNYRIHHEQAGNSSGKNLNAPRKSFSVLSGKQQRRRLSGMHVQETQDVAFAEKVSKMYMKTPKGVNEVRFECLSLMKRAKLSSRQYGIVKNWVQDMIARNFNLKKLPTYKDVMVERDKCIPQGITVNEEEVQVPLQNLLDHHVERMLQRPDIKTKLNDGDSMLHLAKSGADAQTRIIHANVALLRKNMIYSLEECGVPIQFCYIMNLKLNPRVLKGV